MMGALWLVKIKFDYLEVRDNGRPVQVNIIDIPVKCGSSSGSRFDKPYFRFDYKGKTYEKKFYGQHCKDVKHGGKLMLRTDNELSVFIFEDEHIEYSIASLLGVALVLFSCAIGFQLRKKDSNINHNNLKIRKYGGNEI